MNKTSSVFALVFILIFPLVSRGQSPVAQDLATLGQVHLHQKILTSFVKQEESHRKKLLAGMEGRTAKYLISLVEDRKARGLLKNHYQAIEKNRIHRIVHRLWRDEFASAPSLLGHLEKVPPSHRSRYTSLVRTLKIHLTYWSRLNPEKSADLVEKWKEIQKAWRDQRVPSPHWKGKEIPLYRLDHANHHRAFPYASPPTGKGLALRPELNSASVKTLEQIPGLTRAMIEAICTYRKTRSFQGPEELALVREIPRPLVHPLSLLFRVRPKIAKKKWTVMVYMAFDNDLEKFFTNDLNEMELAGSSDEINIVVQLDRFPNSRRGPKVHPDHLKNPHADRRYGHAWTEDNYVGCRRYYVLRDSNPYGIRSVVRQNLGSVDSGHPDTLAQFATWAIQNHPAEKYALFLGGHGTGWTGLSYDGSSRSRMELAGLARALKKIQKVLKKIRPKNPKLDVVDLDACFMATLEVAWELRPYAHYLVASQDYEDDPGNPYDKILSSLRTSPDLSPANLARNIVVSFVQSYSPGGSQLRPGQALGTMNTKSAVSLAQLAPVVKNLDKTAKILLKNPDWMRRHWSSLQSSVRHYGPEGYNLYDLGDLSRHLGRIAPRPAPLSSPTTAINHLFGSPNCPPEGFRKFHKVVRKKPGLVIWGYNQWSTPPAKLAPFVHQGRLAATPLSGPDEKGRYRAILPILPFFTNLATGKGEKVTHLRYQVAGEKSKHTVVAGPLFYTHTAFPSSSPILARGHGYHQSRSHGLSIYFPPYGRFQPSYRRLALAKAAPHWTKLISQYPMAQFKGDSRILVGPIHHLNRSQRKKLAVQVIEEELARAQRETDPYQIYREDLTHLKTPFREVSSPDHYGLNWRTLWARQGQLVVTDQIDRDRLDDHLSRGLPLLLTSDRVLRSTRNNPLFQKVLGLQFVRLESRHRRFALAPPKFSGTITSPGAQGGAWDIPFHPLVVLTKIPRGTTTVTPLTVLSKSGEWVGVKVAGVHPDTQKPFHAVILGFYLADVQPASVRRKIWRGALDFLLPK